MSQGHCLLALMTVYEHLTYLTCFFVQYYTSISIKKERAVFTAPKRSISWEHQSHQTFTFISRLYNTLLKSSATLVYQVNCERLVEITLVKTKYIVTSTDSSRVLQLWYRTWQLHQNVARLLPVHVCVKSTCWRQGKDLFVFCSVG